MIFCDYEILMILEVEASNVCREMDTILKVTNHRSITGVNTFLLHHQVL